jgi:hypothetical protein
MASSPSLPRRSRKKPTGTFGARVLLMRQLCRDMSMHCPVGLTAIICVHARNFQEVLDYLHHIQSKYRLHNQPQRWDPRSRYSTEPPAHPSSYHTQHSEVMRQAFSKESAWANDETGRRVKSLVGNGGPGGEGGRGVGRQMTGYPATDSSLGTKQCDWEEGKGQDRAPTLLRRGGGRGIGPHITGYPVTDSLLRKKQCDWKWRKGKDMAPISCI